MADDITLRDVLGHMQNMQRILLEKFDAVQGDVNVLKTDVGVLKKDMQEVKYDIRLIRTGMDNMDQRLDDIEVEQLPKIKQAVGIT